MKVWLAGFALLLSGSLQAASVSNTFGLSSPASTLTFDEIIFSPGTAINSQYSAYGITFSPDTFYDSLKPSTCCNGIDGHYVGNYSPLHNPFSILFTTPQTAAAFALATNEGTSTFTARLAGLDVESFSSPTNLDFSTPYYFGFTGIVFDEINISAGSDGAALIDNIQQGTSVVPEPGTYVLLGSALAALLGSKLRRRV